MTGHALRQQTEADLRGLAPADLRDHGRHDSVPHAANAVVLALVVALRDVELRRGRGKVLTHLTSKRPAA